MARKSTKGQKATAVKYGVRITKTVRGTRVEKSAEQLKKETASAKAKMAKKKLSAKKKASSTRQTTTGLGNPYSKAADRRIISSTKAGRRISKKSSLITYKSKDPITGKTVTKKVRRQNANKTTPAGTAGGRKYTERRINRTDKGKML